MKAIVKSCLISIVSFPVILTAQFSETMNWKGERAALVEYLEERENSEEGKLFLKNWISAKQQKKTEPDSNTYGTAALLALKYEDLEAFDWIFNQDREKSLISHRLRIQLFANPGYEKAAKLTDEEYSKQYITSGSVIKEYVKHINKPQARSGYQVIDEINAILDITSNASAKGALYFQTGILDLYLKRRNWDPKRITSETLNTWKEHPSKVAQTVLLVNEMRQPELEHDLKRQENFIERVCKFIDKSLFSNHYQISLLELVSSRCEWCMQHEKFRQLSIDLYQQSLSDPESSERQQVIGLIENYCFNSNKEASAKGMKMLDMAYQNALDRGLFEGKSPNGFHEQVVLLAIYANHQPFIDSLKEIKLEQIDKYDYLMVPLTQLKGINITCLENEPRLQPWLLKESDKVVKGISEQLKRMSGLKNNDDYAELLAFQQAFPNPTETGKKVLAHGLIRTLASVDDEEVPLTVFQEMITADNKEDHHEAIALIAKLGVSPKIYPDKNLGGLIDELISFMNQVGIPEEDQYEVLLRCQRRILRGKTPPQLPNLDDAIYAHHKKSLKGGSQAILSILKYLDSYSSHSLSLEEKKRHFELCEIAVKEDLAKDNSRLSAEPVALILLQLDKTKLLSELLEKYSYKGRWKEEFLNLLLLKEKYDLLYKILEAPGYSVSQFADFDYTPEAEEKMAKFRATYPKCENFFKMDCNTLSERKTSDTPAANESVKDHALRLIREGKEHFNTDYSDAFFCNRVYPALGMNIDKEIENELIISITTGGNKLRKHSSSKNYKTPQSNPYRMNKQATQLFTAQFLQGSPNNLIRTVNEYQTLKGESLKSCTRILIDSLRILLIYEMAESDHTHSEFILESSRILFDTYRNNTTTDRHLLNNIARLRMHVLAHYGKYDKLQEFVTREYNEKFSALSNRQDLEWVINNYNLFSTITDTEKKVRLLKRHATLYNKIFGENMSDGDLGYLVKMIPDTEITILDLKNE